MAPFLSQSLSHLSTKEVTGGGGRRESKEEEMEDLDGRCFQNTIFALICTSTDSRGS